MAKYSPNYYARLCFALACFLFFIQANATYFDGVKKLPAALRTLAAQKEFRTTILQLDSAKAFLALNELQNWANSQKDYSLEITTLRLKVEYEQNLGDGHNDKKKINQFLEAAEKVATEQNLPIDLALVAYDRGRFAYYHNQYELAFESFIKTTTILEKIGYEKAPESYKILMDLGHIYYDFNNQEIALNYLLKATHYKPNGSWAEKMTNTAIGLIYNNRKQYDSAIFYHQVVMEIAKKEKDSTWFGIASGNLGTIYLNQYQYNKAIPFFEADVRLSTRAKEWSSSAGSLIRLSKISVIQNNLTLALTQLQAADTMLAKIKNIILNAKLYEEYATLYERLKDLKKALYYQKKWLSAKDSAGIIYNSKILSDIKLKIALETNIHKTKDLELAQKLRSSVVIQRLLYVIIIFVVLIFIINFQYKKRRLLAEQIQQKQSYIDAQLKNANDLNKIQGELNSIIKAIPDIVIRLDVNNNYTYLHTNYPENLTKQEAEYIGKNIRDILPLELVEQLENKIVEAKQTKVLVSRLYTLEIPNNGIQSFESRIIATDDGGIIDIVRNVTAEKNAEAKSKLDADRFQYVTQAATDGIYDWDFKNQQIFLSDNYKSQFNISEENFLGENGGWAKRVHPDDIGNIKLFLKEKFLSNLTTTTFEYRYSNGKGNYLNVIDNAKFLRTETGKVERIVGSLKDITEQKKVASKLQEKLLLTERLIKDKEHILASIADCFYVIDNNYNYLYCNQAMLEILKIEEKELIGKNIFQMFADGCSAIFRDITHRKKMEQQINQSNQELQISKEALTDKNRELESFAYVASHDLQEPLRMVTSFLQKFEQKYSAIVDETGKKYIHFAVDGAERMRILINDLLKYTSANSDRFEKVQVDMNEVVIEVLQLHRERIIDNSVEIIADPLPIVLAGKVSMSQLIQNLIGNGIKYCNQEKAIIKISVKENANEWEFSVTDNGIGIAPDYYQKIFIIFQRLHQKHQYSGTGIGLSICKKIVESYNGKIWVESVLGEGSNFKFTIPKYD
ncbi:MAG: ATP-binding protein [Bacteroidetes bacterium]|nr:ATP-binding protein [Bacteroidota bacterium]